MEENRSQIETLKCLRAKFAYFAYCANQNIIAVIQDLLMINSHQILVNVFVLF